MYATAPACLSRSDVMKMPLMMASHFFALSAGMRPGNAVFTGFAFAPHVSASCCAMSTSKPVILPLAVASSMGGNVGSVQYLNVPACRLAPAVPATTSDAARTSRESIVAGLRIAPP